MRAALAAVLLDPEEVATNAATRHTNTTTSLVRVLFITLRAVDNRAFAFSLLELRLSQDRVFVQRPQFLHNAGIVEHHRVRLATCSYLV
ncbi:hypothetical protein D3C86_1306980 [compost metagenome]